jgi:hypothetical protein
MAFVKLESESGLHSFTREKKTARCLIETSEASIESYKPPKEITRHDAIGHQPKRRHYNLDQSLLDDSLLDRKPPLYGPVTVALLEELVEECLMVKLKKLIED